MYLHPPSHNNTTNNTIIHTNNFKKKQRKRTVSRSSSSSSSSSLSHKKYTKKKILWTLILRILQWTFYIFKFLFITLHRILMTRFVPSLKIKILFLLCPLALFLYLWTGIEIKDDTTDASSSSTMSTHTLATIIALKRHVPSRRVFDCMLEFALVGFCTSFLVYIWECTFYYKLNKDEQQVIWDQLWYIPPLTVNNTGDVSQEDMMEYTYDDDDDDEVNDGIEDHDEDDSDIEHGATATGGGDTHVRRGTMNSLEMVTTTAAHHRSISNTQQTQFTNHHHTIIPTISPGDGSISTAAAASSSFTPSKNKNNHTYVQKQYQQQQLRHSISHQILHASVDLLLLIIVALFLFTMSETVGGYYIDELSSSSLESSSSTTTRLMKIDTNNTSFLSKIVSRIGAVAAPIFPLLLFLYASIHFLFIPWSKTKAKFWTIVSYTITTPMYPVTFRDGLVGDIITSLVRPLQDALFTFIYLICGLRGWWIYNKIPDAVQTELLTSSAMESSWMIHTLLLPACIVLPLWWRYIQTLRQVYQYRSRWPYLGNSGKYFCAAQIAILGIMYPEWRSSPWGIFFFVLVTLYQVSWDVFMDWELLVWRKDGLVLREQRIFHNPLVYYFILTVNILLRFCWTMTFIPSRYLSPTSGLLMYTFSADFSTFKGPALASAEIIRRTLWTILRVEWEVLKVIQRPSASTHGAEMDRISSEESLDSMINYKPETMIAMPIMQSMPSYRQHVGALQSIRSNIQDMVPIFFLTSNMSSASEIQIIRELLLYATLFISFGIIAIIHRGVM